jgi:hypothetical protein
VLTVLCGLAVLALVASGLWSLRGDEEAGSTAAAATPTAAPTSTPSAGPVEPVVVPSAPVTPTPTGPTEDVDELPPAMPAVGLEESAAVGNGITAAVSAVEAIDGTAVGPGNIGGPALRVTVRIDNGTAEPVALGGVAVDLAYGSELTPASPLDDPSQDPFAGTVPAGGSAEGVYVFTVPADARASVTLSVGYQAGAPFLVFTGSAD